MIKLIVLLCSFFGFHKTAVQHSKSYLIDDLATSGTTFTFDQYYVYLPSSNDIVQRLFETGEIKRTLRGHISDIYGLFIVNNTLVSGSVDGMIIAWDLETGEILRGIDSKCSLFSIDLFQDSILVSCSYGISRMINFYTGQVEVLFGDSYIFYVYDNVFYAFYQADGILSYDDNLVKVALYQDRVAMMIRQDSTIIASLYDTYEIFTLSVNNGSVSFFKGTGHTRFVFSLCIVGNYLISSGYDSLLISWDMNTLSQLQILSCHSGSVFKLAAFYSTAFLSSDVSGSLNLCEPSSGKLLRRFCGNPISLSTVSIYGDLLFTSSTGVKVKHWSISSKDLLPALPNNTVTNKLFIDSHYLISCLKSFVIRDILTTEIVKEFATNEVDCTNGYYYFEGFLFAPSYTEPKIISKFNLSSGEFVIQYYTSIVSSDCLYLFAMEGYLFSSYAQNFALQWDINTGVLQYTYTEFSISGFFAYTSKKVLLIAGQRINIIDPVSNELTLFHDMGQLIVALSYDEASGIMFVGGVQAIIYGLDVRNSFQPVYQFQGHSNEITDLLLNGDYLFSCSADGTVKQWSLLSSRLVHSFEDKMSSVTSLACYKDLVLIGNIGGYIYEFLISTSFISNYFLNGRGSITSIIVDDDLLFVSSLDNSISYYNLTTNERLAQFQITSSANILAFYNSFLYSGNDDTNVYQWDFISGTIVKTFTGHNAIINDIKVYDSFLYSAGGDGIICRWNLYNENIVLKYAGHLDQVTSVLVYQDNLFSASLDKTILIWDLTSGQIVMTLKKTNSNLGHIGPINQIKICSGYLLSASSDTTVKQWDTVSGSVIDTLFGHAKAVTCLSCQGSMLFSGSQDFAVFLWYPSFHFVSTSVSNWETLTSNSQKAIVPNKNASSPINFLLISVVVGILVVLVGIIFIIMFVFGYYKRGRLLDTTYDKSSTVSASNYNNATLFTKIPGMAIPGFLEMNLKTFRLLDSKIAKGGGGIIFLAEIFGKQEYFVAKLFDNEYNNLNDLMKLAFDQEITVMEFLKSHRNIAKIVGFCYRPCCILMKYYERGSFTKLIYSKQVISKIKLLQYFHDIVDGIKFMHSKFIVHGDLKPANILIDFDENGDFLVLTDFGISQILSDEHLVAKAFQITNLRGLSVQYAAPEVFKRFREKKNVIIVTDTTINSTDIFSIGVIMVEAATRREPWK